MTNINRSAIRLSLATVGIILCLLTSELSLGTTSFLRIPSVFAQTSTATLSGTVSDENKAVIPGVAVTATNEGTQVKRDAMTNNEGLFTFPLLQPGKYRVDVKREGFTPIQLKNIVLEVGDQQSLRIEIKVGAVGESVTVVDGASLIREDAAVGTVINRQFVENIPLNGRSFQSLITLSPGVVLTRANNSEQGQFSVNGQRADGNYFMVDGVSANIGVSPTFNPGQANSGSVPGFTAGGGTNSLVSVDALQEFKIQTSTYAPEYGRTPGAQINIITRSGTNDFHGTAFEYFRNDTLDANNWFFNSRSFAKPPLRQNNFGGVFGGPILKNRTFFFFSYEGNRLRLPQVKVQDVPSLAARQAAPASIQPFLNVFPRPNGIDRIDPLTGRPTGLAEFAGSYSDPSTLDATSIRIDHTVSSRLTLFGRYNYVPSEVKIRGQEGGSLSMVSATQIKTQTMTVGTTMIISPTVSNDLRGNYSRNRGLNNTQLDNTGGAIPLSAPTLFPSPFSFKDAQFTFLIPGYASYSVGQNVSNLQQQINIVDNLSLTLGSHQLKVGIDYRRISPLYGVRRYNQIIVFDSIGFTSPGVPPPTGSVLSGKTNNSSISANDQNTLFFTNFSAFAQDTWRVNRRLSLTYGTRWEYNPPPSGEKPLITVNDTSDPSRMSLASPGRPLYKTSFTNFAPRVGLVYQLSQKSGRETVLRGGFGIFYDLGTGVIGNAVTSFPYQRDKLLPPNTLFPLSPSDLTPLPFDLNARPLGPIRIADSNLKAPRVYQWNIALEQSLGMNQTISATYAAAVGRSLLRAEQITNPNPDFQVVNLTKNAATSDYHSLQLQFHRHLSRGFQALASYTWAHSIDIASNDSAYLPPSGKVDVNQDRGPSDFDIRHAFTSAITYDIPVLTSGNIGKAILGGWSIDTSFTARSATPVNIIYRKNLPGIGNFYFRPDLIPGVPLYLDDPKAPGGRRFNDTRVVVPGNPNPQIGPFLRPVTLRQGTLGRNFMRGFPLWQNDLALRRQFKITERVGMQFRAEVFNIFNHPNFGDPGTGAGKTNELTSSTFGYSTTMFAQSLGTGGATGGFSPLYQIGGPRSVQLALKLQF